MLLGISSNFLDVGSKCKFINVEWRVTNVGLHNLWHEVSVKAQPAFSGQGKH
jgi:hypothetical protein